MSFEQTWAVAICGIGADETMSNGLIFGLGRQPSGLATSWEWRDALVTTPTFAEDRLDLLTGDLALSGVDVEIDLGTDDTLRQILLFQESRETAALTSGLTETGTTVSLSKTTLAGRVVHVGRETIRLGAHTSGGTYTGCTRAYWRSEANAHPIGTFAYLRPSYWRWRLVRLYEVRGTGQLVQRGEYYLDWRPVTDESALVVRLTLLPVAELVQSLRLAPPPQLQWSDRYAALPTTGEVYLPGFPRLSEVSVWQKASAAGNTSRVYLVDGALIHRYARMSRILAPLLGSQLGGEPGELVRSAREIALWCPRLEAQIKREYETQGVLDPAVRWIAPTSNMPQPHHPLTIAGALLFSTARISELTNEFDVLPQARSLGLRRHISNAGLSKWRNLIAATPELVVDQFLLGAADAPEEVGRKLRDMLRYYGFAIVADSTGYLWPVQIRPGDVEDYANASIASPQSGYLQLAAPQSSTVDAITATVGELPWSPGRVVSTAINSNEAGLGTLAQRQSAELNATLDAPFVSADSAEGVARLRLVETLIYRFQGVPELIVRMEGPQAGGLSHRLGDWIRLADFAGLERNLWLTAEGVATRSFAGEAFLGQIIGRRPIPEEADVFEVRLALTNFALRQAVKWRAPSAILLAADGGDLTVAASSAFGGPGSDADEFREGDQVEVWTSEGAPRNIGVRTITATSGTFIGVDTFFSADPVAGDVLRLARAPDYDNLDGHVDGFARPFVYLAVDETIPDYGGRDVYG